MDRLNTEISEKRKKSQERETMTKHQWRHVPKQSPWLPAIKVPLRSRPAYTAVFAVLAAAALAVLVPTVSYASQPTSPDPVSAASSGSYHVIDRGELYDPFAPHHAIPSTASPSGYAEADNAASQLLIQDWLGATTTQNSGAAPIDSGTIVDFDVTPYAAPLPPAAWAGIALFAYMLFAHYRRKRRLLAD